MNSLGQLENVETGQRGASSMARVVGFLEDDHFYLQEHQVIYRALKSMYVSSIPIDLMSIASFMRKEGTLQSVGGAAYIAELTLTSISDVNVEYHARILIEQAIKRELISIGGEMMSDGYEDTTDALVIVDKYLNELKKVAGWIK